MNRLAFAPHKPRFRKNGPAGKHQNGQPQHLAHGAVRGFARIVRAPQFLPEPSNAIADKAHQALTYGLAHFAAAARFSSTWFWMIAIRSVEIAAHIAKGGVRTARPLWRGLAHTCMILISLPDLVAGGSTHRIPVNQEDAVCKRSTYHESLSS